MDRKYLFIAIIIFIHQASAMQDGVQHETTGYDLNPDCIQTIARYSDQKTGASARRSCKLFNAFFWNYSAQLSVCPVEIKNLEDAEQFWRRIFVRIAAAEALIRRFNPHLDAQKVDIQNPINLCLGFYDVLWLPDEFAQTRCIRSLDVSYNHILQDELENLPRLLPLLYELKLVSCRLENIPQEFRQWASLKRLFLGDNQMSSDSLAENLPRHLEYLDISNCGYFGVPPFLAQLKLLKGLNFSFNIGRFPPAELSKIPTFCPQLEELDLSYNGLCVIPPGAFKSFNKLLRLNLYENDLNCFAALCRLPFFLPDLEELDLGQNGLVLVGIFQEFNRFKRLKKLNLATHASGEDDRLERRNKFSAEDQNKLAAMMPLTNIIFSGDKIS